jgi:hypothetical protein
MRLVYVSGAMEGIRPSGVSRQRGARLAQEPILCYLVQT